MTPPPREPSTAESTADDAWVHVPSLEDICFKLASAANRDSGITNSRRHMHAARRCIKHCFIGVCVSFIFSFVLRFGLSGVVNRLHVVQFDPYAVLGIDHGTDLLGIRRAYRRHSLRYHPDKISPPNHSGFNKAAMAYHVLETDESCREDHTQAVCWAGFSTEQSCVDTCGCGCEIRSPGTVARLALTLCARLGLVTITTSWRVVEQCAARCNFEPVRGFRKRGMSMIEALSHERDSMPNPDVLSYLEVGRY